MLLVVSAEAEAEMVAWVLVDEVVVEMEAGTQELVAAVAKRRARRKDGVCILKILLG